MPGIRTRRVSMHQHEAAATRGARKLQRIEARAASMKYAWRKAQRHRHNIAPIRRAHAASAS